MAPITTFDTFFARTTKLLIESDRLITAAQQSKISSDMQVAASRKAIDASSEALCNATAQLVQCDLKPTF